MCFKPVKTSKRISPDLSAVTASSSESDQEPAMAPGFDTKDLAQKSYGLCTSMNTRTTKPIIVHNTAVTGCNNNTHLTSTTNMTIKHAY